MFLPVLLVTLAGAAIHFSRGADRSRSRAAELVLRWVLVAYCGVPMVVVALAALVAPTETLGRFGFDAGGPVTSFLAWGYLGMALAACTAIRGSRPTLLAPALAWITFFLGATSIHLHAGHGLGGHGPLFYILATHLLISVLLATALLAGGSREGTQPASRNPVRRPQ